jgi:1,2-dihydroxy-3-keto-5-methylthiopentene dioxygenase
MVVRIPEEGRKITETEAIRAYLAGIDIEYEIWEPSQPVGPDASNENILQAYSGDIDKLKARGGYVTADVVNVNAATRPRCHAR